MPPLSITRGQPGCRRRGVLAQGGAVWGNQDTQAATRNYLNPEIFFFYLFHDLWTWDNIFYFVREEQDNVHEEFIIKLREFIQKQLNNISQNASILVPRYFYYSNIGVNLISSYSHQTMSLWRQNPLSHRKSLHTRLWGFRTSRIKFKIKLLLSKSRSFHIIFSVC